MKRGTSEVNYSYLANGDKLSSLKEDGSGLVYRRILEAKILRETILKDFRWLEKSRAESELIWFSLFSDATENVGNTLQ